MLKTVFLAIISILPDKIVVLFAGTVTATAVLLGSPVLGKCHETLVLVAEYARYQQLHDMPVHSESSLRTLTDMIHK